MNLTQEIELLAYLIAVGMALFVARRSKGMILIAIVSAVLIGFYFGIPEIGVAAVSLMMVAVVAIIVGIMFFGRAEEI